MKIVTKSEKEIIAMDKLIKYLRRRIEKLEIAQTKTMNLLGKEIKKHNKPTKGSPCVYGLPCSQLLKEEAIK